jgi:hypothetical protein
VGAPILTGVRVVAVRLHGVAHTDDLGVQAFARHLATAGPEGRSTIAGMRGFLEGRPELIPPGAWDTPPQTGYEAVRLLAAAAGCSRQIIDAAYRSSRTDLAASAWVLDPADGFDNLLLLLRDRARLVVVGAADDPATEPVLAALDLAGRMDELLDDHALTDLVRAPRPALLVDMAWTPAMVATHAAGQTTALLDRFDRGAGTPTVRARTLTGMLPGVAAWLDAAGIDHRRAVP